MHARQLRFVQPRAAQKRSCIGYERSCAERNRIMKIKTKIRGGRPNLCGTVRPTYGTVLV